jgi:hypothetical protein
LTILVFDPRRQICRAGLGTLLCLCAPLFLHSQTPTDSANATEAVPTTVPESYERILGIIPNFQTVSDPTLPYTPLRVRDKWKLFVRETVDPFTFASAAAGAAISQIDNDDPKYGYGAKPYLQRFGAAQADVATQNFFSDAVLASLFHEDPRYFRRGPGYSVANRVAYALSRIVITKRDSGQEGFNFSGIVGTGMGIALSDAYYPPRSVGGGELESRIVTSLAASAMGNLLPEFWPDIRQKMRRKRQKNN